jgi:hypothetical protein
VIDTQSLTVTVFKRNIHGFNEIGLQIEKILDSPNYLKFKSELIFLTQKDN